MKLIFGYRGTTYLYDSESGALRKQTEDGSIALPAEHPALQRVIIYAETLLIR